MKSADKTDECTRTFTITGEYFAETQNRITSDSSLGIPRL